MQPILKCFPNILEYKYTVNFNSYIFSRPVFEKWINNLQLERRQTYIKPAEFIQCLARIPEVRCINNLILPNWIIANHKDVDHLLPIFGNNSELWKIYKSYDWIDIKGICIYRHKYLNLLQTIISELIKHCNWLILNVPPFMTMSVFWDWLLKCASFNDDIRSRIIFFTPVQSQTYKTFAASGNIPLNIAKKQHQFYSEKYKLSKLTTTSQLLSPLQLPSPLHTASNMNPHSESPHNLSSLEHIMSHKNESITQLHNSDLIVINELDKLRDDLIKYNINFPDELHVETGALIDKMNDMRDILGIKI